uniref:V-set and immunoglobulin domain containing 10 n=1 Tax=Leptobrachium leishanense TaxID=445787 RepID=A0A8C5LR76_9ANUR
MGSLSRPLLGGLLLALYLSYGISAGVLRRTLTGEEHERMGIPCQGLKSTIGNTSWFKDGNTQPLLACDGVSSDERFSRQNASSLVISSLWLQDEGNYTCRECSGQEADEDRIQLLVSRGPRDMKASIYPVHTLPNGTLYTFRGSALNFSCSCESYPVPNMEWTFTDPDGKPELFYNQTGNVANFSLINMAFNLQGYYSCLSKNPITGRSMSSTHELLVYYPPPSQLTCSANNSDGLSELVLSCAWTGGYPSPALLQWKQDGELLRNQADTDTLVVSLNRSVLTFGQKLECRGEHLSNITKGNSCQIQIDPPMLQAQPLRTCLLGENVTLSCSVSGASPPAVITWLRNWSDPEIEIKSGKKYSIFQSDTTSYLTISNCSNDGDEGYYVCKAENVLAKREIQVWLTISKQQNIAGLVSAILLLVLLSVALIVGVVLYCDPQFYLKGRFFRSSGNEVMILVDEAEEEELEEMRESPDSATATDIAASTPVVNGNIYKHKVLFHHPPDNISPALSEDFTEETETENPSEDL